MTSHPPRAPLFSVEEQLCVAIAKFRFFKRPPLRHRCGGPTNIELGGLGAREGTNLKCTSSKRVAKLFPSTVPPTHVKWSTETRFTHAMTATKYNDEAHGDTHNTYATRHAREQATRQTRKCSTRNDGHLPCG